MTEESILTQKNADKQRNKLARRAVNSVCLMFLVSVVLENLFAVDYYFANPYITDFFSKAFAFFTGSGDLYASTFIKNVSGTLMSRVFVTMVSSFLCTFLPFVLYSKVTMKQSFDETAPMNGRLIKGFIPVFAAAQLMSSIASVLAQNIESFIFPDMYYSSGSGASFEFGAQNGFELVVMFLSLCVLTPFVEEFVFRGVIFGSLKKYGTGFAVVASSAVFGLAHGEISQMAYAFSFGVVLALVYYKTGSLKTSVMFHFINNFVNYILFTLVPYFASDELSSILGILYNVICGAVAVFGLGVLFLKKQEKEDHHVTESKLPEAKLKALLSPGFFLVICLFITYIQG